MACVGGENKVRTLLIFCLKYRSTKDIYKPFFPLYSVELNCIITEGASLDQKTASL